MKTKIIVLGVMLSLVSAPAYARVSHSNPYKNFKHTRMVKTYRGHIRVYNP